MVTDHIASTGEGVQAIFKYRSYSARERDIIVSRGKGTLLAKRDNYFLQRYIVEKGGDCYKQRVGNMVSQREEYCKERVGDIVSKGRGLLSAKRGEYC